MIMEIVALCLGCALGAIAMQLYRTHRAAENAAAWILVANVNTLLRLDLEHLTGDDENAGLCEMRVALKEMAAKRDPGERRLLERFNALVGVAIAFGERVHDAAGNVDMRAVANRRAHLQNALVLGDRLEAALGGIAELAIDPLTERGMGPLPRKRPFDAAALALRTIGHHAAPAPAALPAIAAPASSAGG